MTQKQNAVLQIRLPKHLRDRFQGAVEADGHKVSDVLRSFMEVYVESRENLSEECRAKMRTFW